ncbi:MAG: hypothetical protein CVU73_10960 [Deltaproteobacteria bacterium HGW-Deltaproteobacteria-8]|jgi:phage repressor protein C with HTH and peptisase S24 domain|nr:MAG: hypothetical protein CVU73_10960 [Deltaproteobacteria bacterium HGW-Deltaproteobacteria-8]
MEKKPNALRTRVEKAMKSRGINSQKALAPLVGCTYQHLNAALNGRDRPGRALLEKLANVLMIKTSDLIAAEQDMFPEDEVVSGYVRVPLRAASGAMGGGSLEGSKRIKTYLAFREDWAFNKGNPNTMSVIRAYGESMGSTIPDGCMVLIDESQTVPQDNKIYYVLLNDVYLCKRVRVIDGKTYLESDQDGSRIEIHAHDHFEPLGRALWYGCEL